MYEVIFVLYYLQVKLLFFFSNKKERSRITLFVKFLLYFYGPKVDVKGKQRIGSKKHATTDFWLVFIKAPLLQ